MSFVGSVQMYKNIYNRKQVLEVTIATKSIFFYVLSPAFGLACSK